jgi:flagellar biosynthesis protein FlhB
MQEKTEKPSQRKLNRARKEGDVPYSADLVSALVLGGGLLLLWGLSTGFQRGLQECFLSIFSNLNTLEPTEALKHVFRSLIEPVSLFLGGVCVIAFLAHFCQTGWIWGGKKKREKSHFLLLPLKVGVIATLGYFSLKGSLLSHKPFSPNLFSLSIRVVVSLILIGMCDLFYQKWRCHQRMRMTKYELREERREVEGEHHIKSKLRTHFTQKR